MLYKQPERYRTPHASEQKKVEVSKTDLFSKTNKIERKEEYAL